MDEHLMRRTTVGYMLDADHMIQYARAQAATIYLLRPIGHGYSSLAAYM